MKIIQRIVCPKCGKGFVVNPKPPEEYVHMMGEPTLRLIRVSPQVPHCAECGEEYAINIDTETLIIEIFDVKK